MLFHAWAGLVSDASAAEIAHELQRLRNPIRVLYVAAHPDDENTQLLTWLARGRSVRAGYLSLTRGDGGQNLIGAEQRPLLGVIRTHELLAARGLDGAEQWFTRLRDFGYSKSAEETLRKWGEETALGEVVRVYRAFRPHVVITRFPEEGDTHGHHLASARLARAAFETSGDPSRFPEHAEHGLTAWRPERLYYNYPTFWARRGQKPPPGLRFDVDVGAYDPWLGASYGEISGRSRSMHRSQGFGASARTGPFLETLIHLNGSTPPDGSNDPFADLESWADVPGGAAFSSAVGEALERFRGDRPEAILPGLARAHQAAAGLQDDTLKEEMQKSIEALLARCAGLLVEVRSETAEVAPGREQEVEARVLVRSPDVEVVLRSVSGPGFETTPRTVLKTHKPWTQKFRVRAPAGLSPTTPHWISKTPTEALYPIPADIRSLQPVVAGPLPLTFGFGIGGVGFELQRSPRRHWVDPVLGERTEALEIDPGVSVNFGVDVLFIPQGTQRELQAEVRAGPGGFRGQLQFDGVSEVEPASLGLKLDAGESRGFSLRVRSNRPGELAAQIKREGPDGQALSRAVVDYPHIPLTVVRSLSTVKIVPVDLTLIDGPIAYVPGSGDRVADILGRVGLEVEVLDGPALRSASLSKYRAVLTGIRAFNVNSDVLAARSRLMAYVQNGGTMVVQYNTQNWSSKLPAGLGPYPMEIFRGRVTDETADVQFLAPEHPVLRTPHIIGPADFGGWVQERGLYFAKEWDERYTPLFSMADADEEALEGSTLVAEYGQGTYIFSGLSFFRQLPAGNPGALRLLVNFLRGARSKTAGEQVAP